MLLAEQERVLDRLAQTIEQVISMYQNEATRETTLYPTAESPIENLPKPQVAGPTPAPTALPHIHQPICAPKPVRCLPHGTKARRTLPQGRTPASAGAAQMGAEQRFRVTTP